MISMPFVLFLFMSTDSDPRSGAASVTYKFENQAACMNAGNLLVNDADKRGNYILSWACVPVNK